MIFIGMGGNLPGAFGPPLQSLTYAVSRFAELGMAVIACSPWYGAQAVPVSDQPDFVNGVIQVETGLTPLELLEALHGLERLFGRVRGAQNAARTLDIDILAYHELCRNFSREGDQELIIPHPRMHQRAFVLAPLCDIAPEWRHPGLGVTAEELLAALPKPHSVWRL